MKKQIFTLLILVGLVGFTSKLFAQGTAVAPWEGTEHTYTLSGIDNGSTYAFYVNQSSTNWLATTTLATVTSGATGSVTAGTATGQVQFNSTSAGAGLFYVWVVVTTDGCSVPRALLVDPVPASAYAVTYGILAISTGDNSTTGDNISTPAGGISITDCPTFVGADLVYETIAGSVDNGDSYVYYKVTRTSTVNAPWEIDVTNSGVSATDWIYSTDPAFGTSAVFTSGGKIAVPSGNVVYLRGILANSTLDQAVTLEIANGNETESTQETVTHSAASATLTVTGVPAVGTFSGL